MSVPDFQSLMLPLLRMASDAREWTVSEVRDALAKEFKLTDVELSELLPSGTQSRFHNRVRWAHWYLQRAGLLERTGRGKFRIGERGRHALSAGLPHIDLNYLNQFSEIRELRQGGSVDDEETQTAVSSESTALTPEESIATAYARLRSELGSHLLEKVKAASPAFFEVLVVELLVKMGYGGSRQDAGKAIGRSGDEGIDGVINEDRLGLDVVYIQAKRWEGSVGRPQIQQFAGALAGRRARKGVFITTSSFTKDAREFSERIDARIVLIDGAQLTELMIDFGLGVTTQAQYEIKRVDSDYFDPE